MRYLVTGAAGFIASRVCELLLADGHSVVGIDNLNDYYDVRLKYYRLAQLARQAGVPEAEVVRCGLSVDGWKSPVPTTNSQHPVTLKSDRFEFHTLDIEDLPALERVFARSNFSAVFNLAARAGVRYSIENPHVYLSTNAQGTLNILECMRRHGVKKQVLASTSSLYAGCPMPFTEDQPVNEPLSPYAASKKAAELMAYTYHRLYAIDTTVVRYFTVFGPAGRPDMAPFRFIEWIIEDKPIELYGDGSQSRDFTYVDDVARGTILAGRLYGDQLPAVSSQLTAHRSQLPAPGSSLSAPGYAIINLGGGNNPISLHALIALMEQCLGRKATTRVQPPHAADLKETWADIAKAGRLLGWKPEVSTEEGIRRTVDWHLAQRDWLRALKF